MDQKKIRDYSRDIDFKAIVDALDDSVFITDKYGTCIYVNPAYEKNTTISPDEVIGRNVNDIVKEGRLFTGGASLDVLATKQKSFRLSTVNKVDPPEVGYTVGVPIFDENGELDKVVVNSRPIFTFRGLKEDYEKFVSLANESVDAKKKVTVTHDNSSGFSEKLIGSSESLKHIWSIIETAAPTDATVLITGESGVGKEVVADEIYRLSTRNDRPFIKVNCASIPANLLESELFGYEKGAFSGASVNGKPGLFELANGGTLLLDEIGDMPMDLQVKLLRAIQDKEITRVGGTRPIKLDIRFIAATNSSLKDKIAEGTFRQDLFYRLNVIPISVPPLRERKADLPGLCDYFVSQFTRKHRREFQLTPEQMKIINDYSWPGNIRELENVIEYLTICASGTKLVADDLLRSILDISNTSSVSGSGTADYSSDSQTSDSHTPSDMNEKDSGSSGMSSSTLADSVQEYEKSIIEATLAQTSSLREAGQVLGVNASTLSRKIKQYGIDYANSR
ncbi:MAG: sigma-54 interaction domain-containing protein [Emergencia sp.]